MLITLLHPRSCLNQAAAAVIDNQGNLALQRSVELSRYKNSPVVFCLQNYNKKRKFFISETNTVSNEDIFHWK